MAEAFFRFGTDIEQTRRQIASGLAGIASDLAKQRGGNVSMFDGLVTAANEAARKASAALGVAGGRLAGNVDNRSAVGGGDQLAAEYKRIRAAAVAETQQAAKELGLGKAETAAAARQVRTAIDALFKNIADQLAAQQQLSRAAFLRGEVPGRGLETNQRAGRPAVPTDNTRQIARIEALGDSATAPLQRRAAQLRAQEGLKPGQAQEVVKAFNDQFVKDITQAKEIQARRGAQEQNVLKQGEQEQKARTAVEKSVARNQAKQSRELDRERTRAHTEALKVEKARNERALFQQVTSDPATQKLSGGRFLNGGSVYKTGGEGLVLERNLQRQTKAFEDSERAIQREAQSRSLIQSFLGGLTSSGFGANAQGFDPNGIARSFGSTVKFSAQYQALQLIQTAFTDTIKEAIDYRDSLTDLNVALGEGEEASGRYVDALSQISKITGGNVGEAIDSSARGIRAFAFGQDEATKNAVGQDVAAQAANLSIIANKPIPDATGDLIAIGSAFGLTADNLDQLVDALAAAKQQAGGDPKQIAQGLASGGTALAAAGFSVAEAAQLMGKVNAELDQSGQASATRISRITSSFNSQAGRNLLGDLGIDRNISQRDQLVEIANRSTLKEDEGGFTPAQNARIKSVLGGTANLRELQVIIKSIGGDLKGGFADGFDTAGKAQDEVDRKTSDLAGHLKELTGTVKNIQNELFDSGLFAPFLAALAGAQPLLNTLELLLKTINEIGDAVEGVATLGGILPDDIGGVGLKEIGVGILQIILLRKALNFVRATGAAATTVETAAIAGNTAATVGNATASAAEASAERIAAATRAANTLAINAETAALTVNTAAKTGNALTSGALGSVDELGNVFDKDGNQVGGKQKRRRGAGILDSATDFIGRRDTVRGKSIPTGKIIGGTIAAVVVAEVYNNAIAAVERTTESIKKQTEAQRSLASGSDDVVESLRAAAEKRRDAGRGFFGTIQDTLGQGANAVADFLPFIDGAEAGVDSEKDAKRLEAAARIEEERRKSNEEERKARQGPGARFDDIFGDFNNIDSLKAGIEELDAAGASSTRQVKLLADALNGVGETSAPGFVAPGGGRRLGEQVANVFFDSAQQALTNYILTKQGVDVGEDNEAIAAARKKVDEAKKRREDNQRADPGRDKDDASTKSDDKAVKDAEKELKEASERRKKASGVATVDLEKFNPATANAKELAELRTKVSDTVTAFIEAAAPNGGVLNETQLNDLATQLAELYVNEGQGGKGLKETRAEMQKILVEQLKDLTDPSKLIFDQSSADFAQDFFIQKSSGVESESVLNGASKVQGIRDRIATIQEGITATLAAGQQVSDAANLAILQGNKDLAAAISDEKTAIENLAIVKLGQDDAVGKAAGEYAQAQRKLGEAYANPNDIEALTRAQAAEFETREALIDAQVDALNALAAANIAPGDNVGAAAAEVEAAGRTLANTAQFGADGNQTAAYSDAVKAFNEAIRGSIDAQLAQIAAMIQASTSSEDVVQNALDAYQIAANQLANTPQFGADGKQTEEFSNNKRAQQDAFNDAVKAVDRQAGQINVGSVREADVVGKTRKAEEEAQRAVNQARRLGADDGTIAELEDALERARNARIEAYDKQADQILLASKAPKDEIGRVQAGVEIAVRNLQRARNAGADAGTIAELEAELRVAQEARDDAVRESQFAMNLARIDPRNSLARAQEVTRQARARLAELQRQGATGKALADAMAALNEATIAEAEAALASRAVRRRGNIDVTDPVAEARAARQDAEDALATSKATNAPADTIRQNELDLKNAQAAEEQAAFQQRLDQVQTNERLGRISHSAYIAYLQGEKERLEAIATRTVQQQEQLDQIDGLLQEAANAAAGQFNIGDIKLPTIYEARRYGESVFRGDTKSPAETRAGLVNGLRADSAARNVSITVNGSDFTEIFRAINAALGTSLTSQTTTTGTAPSKVGF